MHSYDYYSDSDVPSTGGGPISTTVGGVTSTRYNTDTDSTPSTPVVTNRVKSTISSNISITDTDPTPSTPLAMDETDSIPSTPMAMDEATSINDNTETNSIVTDDVINTSDIDDTDFIQFTPVTPDGIMSTRIHPTSSIPVSTDGITSTGDIPTSTPSTPVTIDEITSTRDYPASTSFTSVSTDEITSTRDYPASTPSTSVTTDEITSTGDSSSIGVIIGGAAGGVVMVLLVGVAIIALCVMVAKIPSKKQHGIQDNESMELKNVIYEGSARMMCVYVCVCLCVYVHVCVHACVHAFMHVFVGVSPATLVLLPSIEIAIPD